MGLLIGFTTILVVIAAGAALAHVGVLDRRSQRTLGEIAFFVASPALMVVTISQVHLEAAAANLVASSVSLAACFAAYVVVARLRWRLDTGPLLVGALSSSYVNAGNLGIAIAAYVVGDITGVRQQETVPDAVVRQADQTPFSRALGIGLCQMIALIPGVSRSGATIVGARMLGLERAAAAEFSFFLAIPTMTAAFV